MKKLSSDGHVHSRKNGGALIICCKTGLISEHSMYFENYLQKKQEIEVYIGFYLYFCIVPTLVCGLMGTTTLRNKRHCTLCFW